MKAGDIVVCVGRDSSALVVGEHRENQLNRIIE